MPAVLLVLTLIQPKPFELKTPLAASPDGMSQIMAIRELSDGRVLVIDVKEKTVQLLDKNLGSPRTIGREGKGPGEYVMPVGLVPMAGDLTYLVDALSQRFLPIQSDGSTAPPVTFASLFPGLLLAAPPAIDRQGRLYFQGFTADIKALAADSAPILRLDPKRKTIDTVAYFRPQKINIAADAGKVRLGSTMMFAPEEGWTVTADGQVVRAVPDPYHLVIYAAGKAVVGPALSYEPVKVTDAEKAEARKRWEEGIARGKAAAAQAGGKNAPQLSVAEPTFAATKPPFTGRLAISAAPYGEIWVERSRSFREESGGLYDRFDVRGRLVGQAKVNPKSRVVGFGKGVVYVVRRDEDDLQYLERYRSPK